MTLFDYDLTTILTILYIVSGAVALAKELVSLVGPIARRVAAWLVAGLVARLAGLRKPRTITGTGAITLEPVTIGGCGTVTLGSGGCGTFDLVS